MDFGRRVEEVKRTFGGVINLVFIPVRLPGALANFVFQTTSHWWKERRARKRERVVDIGSLSGSSPWLPDPRRHH